MESPLQGGKCVFCASLLATKLERGSRQRVEPQRRRAGHRAVRSPGGSPFAGESPVRSASRSLGTSPLASLGGERLPVRARPMSRLPEMASSLL